MVKSHYTFFGGDYGQTPHSLVQDGQRQLHVFLYPEGPVFGHIPLFRRHDRAGGPRLPPGGGGQGAAALSGLCRQDMPGLFLVLLRAEHRARTLRARGCGRPLPPRALQRGQRLAHPLLLLHEPHFHRGLPRPGRRGGDDDLFQGRAGRISAPARRGHPLRRGDNRPGRAAPGRGTGGRLSPLRRQGLARPSLSPCQ